MLLYRRFPNLPGRRVDPRPWDGVQPCRQECLRYGARARGLTDSPRFGSVRFPGRESCLLEGSNRDLFARCLAPGIDWYSQYVRVIHSWDQKEVADQMKNNPRARFRRNHGFTRADLVSVVSCVCLVAGLALTTAWTHRQAAQTEGCRANLRRLSQAFNVFALDHRDFFPGNRFYAGGGNQTNWCDRSFLDFTASPRNWDPSGLTNGSLWPYVAEADIWNCPGDPSIVSVPNVGERRRIRSYSMNSFIGNPANSLPANYRTFSKVSEMNLMGAEKAFLILDEHPGSINDGTFYVDMSGFENQPSSRQWLDYPGSHHLGAANLSFADGHVETWSWRDARTKPPFKSGPPLTLNGSSPNNPDIYRLQLATTIPF